MVLAIEELRLAIEGGLKVGFGEVVAWHGGDTKKLILRRLSRMMIFPVASWHKGIIHPIVRKRYSCEWSPDAFNHKATERRMSWAKLDH